MIASRFHECIMCLKSSKLHNSSIHYIELSVSDILCQCSQPTFKFVYSTVSLEEAISTSEESGSICKWTLVSCTYV